MMIDKYRTHSAGLESPARHIELITPSDTADLECASRAVSVAGAGDLRVTMIDGSEGTLFLAAGIAFPIRVTRIWDAGTTATGIVALS